MTLVSDVIRTQARIKSMYRLCGVLVAGVDVYSSRRREEWLEHLPSSTKMRAARLDSHFDFLLDQKKQAGGDLLREAKKHPILKILETAPGFGPIRAARLVPIVITPHRFRTKRQFWSYCGLGIVTRSSSDWVQTTDGAWIKARTPQTHGLSGPALLRLFGSEVPFVPASLWAILALAAFSERYGAMHLQLYTTTNHVLWHKISAVYAAIFLTVSFALVGRIGVFAFPVAMLSGYAGFFAWYNARLSHRAFRLGLWSFEGRAMAPQLMLLAVGLAIILGW